VERDCLAAANEASPIDRIVLCEAARLADKLGNALEGGAIEASHFDLWRGYADVLENVVRLVGSAMPAAWIVNSIADCADKIGTPQTGL
jgi:hypothetical protein